MATNLLNYEEEIAHEALCCVSIPPADFVDATQPLGVLNDLLQPLGPEAMSFFAKYGARKAAYYALMAGRECLPSFFPVHDIQLGIANLLRPALQHGRPLVLLDWELLPAALLAAPPGSRVTLPLCLGAAVNQEKDASYILRELRNLLPDIHWDLPETTQPPDLTGAVVIGQHPLRHGERDPRFLEKLADIACGLLYTSWDFLGVKIHAHTRSLWIKAGIMQGVLQLPRPRRQGSAVYPTLLLLGEANPLQPLRMAHIPSCGPGPGVIDQQQIVSMLQGHHKGKQENTLDITPEELARDGLFNLSPAYHLANQNMAGAGAHSTVTLRTCAQVLRCQLPRERLGDDDIQGLEAEESVTGLEMWGEGRNGNFICREVALGELDPLTGFLQEQGGNIVRVQLTLLGKQGKYVLQGNDILFAFRGTQASIGKVGIVEEEGPPAITGQALCIIRCLPGTDAVWLYYYLQRSFVKDWICGKATGGKLLTINLDAIRDIPVALPDRHALDAVHEEHRAVAAAMSKIAELRREVHTALHRIWEREQMEDYANDIRAKRAKGEPIIIP